MGKSKIISWKKKQYWKYPIDADVSNTEKYADIAAHVDEVTGGEGINLLINNAGIYEGQQESIRSLKKEAFLKHLEVNTLGPIFLTQVF